MIILATEIKRNDIIVGRYKKNRTAGNEMFGKLISIFRVSKCVLLLNMYSYVSLDNVCDNLIAT